MNGFKNLIIIEIIIGLIGLGIIVISYFYNNLLLTIIGLLIVVVNVFLYLITKSFELFKKDKELDIEALIRQGLTIVNCINCDKKNVFEDKYCIYCGEELKKNDENI